METKITAYHYSNNDFDKFDISKVGANGDEGYFGKGLYFTGMKNFGSGFGNIKYTVELDIENPFNFELLGNSDEYGYNIDNFLYFLKDREPVDTEYPIETPDEEIDSSMFPNKIDRYNLTINAIHHGKLIDYSQAITDYVKQYGFDSIISDSGLLEIVIFNPRQIRIINKEYRKKTKNQEINVKEFLKPYFDKIDWQDFPETDKIYNIKYDYDNEGFEVRDANTNDYVTFIPNDEDSILQILNMLKIRFDQVNFMKENKNMTKIGRILNKLNEDFSTTTTGMSFYDDSLDYSDYARETKENFSEVFMMSPDDYIDLCTYGFQSTGSNTSKDKLLSSRKLDKEDIEKYKDIIQNETMDMPVLEMQISDDPNKDLDSFGQEGLHRAIAAKELGIKQIPVLVMFRGKQGLKALRRFSKISNYKQITNNWTNYQWKNNFVDNASELYESEENKFNDNFWKWFGDSKVVDKQGKPLVVYHGTNSKFKEFKTKKIGTHTDKGMYGKGFYFMDDANQTYQYGKHTISCYIRITNPLRLGRGGEYDTIHDYGNAKVGIPEIKNMEDYNKYADKLPTMEAITGFIKEDGYDGVIVTPFNGAETEYVVFNPNQIKSVDNNGYWSTSSNNIYENKSEDRLQQAMSLLNKVDGVISLDPSFFGKFGKTFDSKLDRVMKIKSPKTKLKRAIELLKNAQGSLIDEQFDDLNEMIDKFLAIQENKNMNEAGYNWNAGMSNNAVSAYAQGKKPLSKWNKKEIIVGCENLFKNPNEWDKEHNAYELSHAEDLMNFLKSLPLKKLREVALDYKEYHHTGKYYNSTEFYDLYDNIGDLVDSISQVGGHDIYDTDEYMEYLKSKKNNSIRENKNMTKIGRLLNYLDEEKKSSTTIDKYTKVTKDFTKIASDELSKANLDTNDNGINKKELEKITDQDLEESDELTPGQKSLAWENYNAKVRKFMKEGFNDLKTNKPRLRSLATDIGDLAKDTVVNTAHALTGDVFRKRRPRRKI